MFTVSKNIKKLSTISIKTVLLYQTAVYRNLLMHPYFWRCNECWLSIIVIIVEVDEFLLLASSTFLTSLSLRADDSHGVMPTLAAPLIDKVYMLDYYRVAGDEQRLFWADEGTPAIATATIDGSRPTNIIDLPIGKIRHIIVACIQCLWLLVHAGNVTKCCLYMYILKVSDALG